VHPARKVRDIGRVPLMAHPCATAECARFIAHTPLGPDRPLPPQCNGDPEKARAARSCAQKQRQERPLPPSAPSPALRAGEGKASLPLRSGGSCRAATEGGAFAVALGVPVSRGEGRTDPPAGAARGIARRSRTHRDVRRANPGLTSRTAAGGAAPGVCSLWLLSLAQARESGTRAGRARNTERMRLQKDQEQELDSSLRWNDQREQKRHFRLCGLRRQDAGATVRAANQ
jgi:hypothetical protein